MAKTDNMASYTTRPRSTRRSRRIGYWIIGPLVAMVLAVYAGANLPTAISVAQGHGTHGTFTAEQYTTAHHGQRSWTGTFTAADNGQVIKDVPYDDNLPDAVRGTKVSALYVDGAAYTANGSRKWVYYLVLFVVGLAVFGVWCARVPIGYLRRRGSVPPPPWVSTA